MKINPIYLICLSFITPSFSQEPEKRIENELRRQVAQEMERMKNAPQVEREERAERAEKREQWMIGIMAHPVEPMLRKHMKLEEGKGILVARVLPQSPAAQAGIKQDDIIIAANKQAIGNLEHLRAQVIVSAKENKPLMLEVIQEGNRRQLRINPPAAKDQPHVQRPEIQRPNIRIEEFLRRFEQQQNRISSLEEKIEKLNDKISQLSERQEKQQKQEKEEKKEKRDKQD